MEIQRRIILRKDAVARWAMCTNNQQHNGCGNGSEMTTLTYRKPCVSSLCPGKADQQGRMIRQKDSEVSYEWLMNARGENV